MSLAQQMHEKSVKSYQRILEEIKLMVFIEIDHMAESGKTYASVNIASGFNQDIVEWLVSEEFIVRQGVNSMIKIEW